MPGRRHELVAYVQASHAVSERRSCSALGVERSSVRYISHKPDQTSRVMRIRDLAATRTRYGYFRIYILLRREGWDKAQGCVERGTHARPWSEP